MKILALNVVNENKGNSLIWRSAINHSEDLEQFVENVRGCSALLNAALQFISMNIANTQPK